MNLRTVVARVLCLLRRWQVERELDEEVLAHLEQAEQDNRRAGMSPDEARRAARRSFGGVEQMKEAHRDMRGFPRLTDLAQDIRHSVRTLARSPAFTVAAVLSLAVGIGANAAVFTIVDRVLLRPLPVADPQELVLVARQQGGEQSLNFSYPSYMAVRSSNILSGVAARWSMSMNATVNAHVARLRGELVSGGYFDMLGVGAQLGRPLAPEDDRIPGAHPVAVISDGFWQGSFGSDPSVVGRAIRINNYPFTIVGVAVKGFTGTAAGVPTDVWLPMVMQKEAGRGDFLTDAATTWLEIIGRLKPGVSTEHAGAVLTAHARTRMEEYLLSAAGREENEKRFPRRLAETRLVLLPGDKGHSPLRSELGLAFRVLLALTALALVLACVNLASLLVVRSVAREQEIAVRLALGAGRSRLVRQFLTESLVLAGLGGAVGLVIAPWAARLLVASQSASVGIDPSLDMRVFLFGLAASVLTGMSVALAPILSSRKVGLAHVSKDYSRSSHDRHGLINGRDLIVTCQLAVSLVMLISAMLFLQSLRSLRSVDPGFRADNLLLMSVDPGSAGYDEDRLEQFWRDTLDRVSKVRGARSVSLARMAPLASSHQRQPWFNPTSGEFTEIDTNFVGPRYFRTLGVPLLRGREFGERDRRSSRPVVIISERTAEMFWPEQDPIRKGLRLVADGPVHEIVGVAKDTKYQDLRDDPGPMVYRSVFQAGSRDPMTVLVRAASDPNALAGTIRREIQMLDPNLPLFGITTLEDQLNASFAQTRQAAVLTGGFGILALLLSAIGVYAVTALAVSRQTHDIGVRVALGARPRHIVSFIGGRSLTLVIMGLTLGVLGSLAFTHLVGGLLYGITAGDSATFAGTSALLAAVSAAAIYLPARRATRLDPVAAIRYE